MDFRILGPLQVSDDGHDIVIRGEKLRSLLGLFLVNANRAVSEDVLIAGWSNGAPMISLQAGSSDESFGDQRVVVAFDNFVITAAQPAC